MDPLLQRDTWVTLNSGSFSLAWQWLVESAVMLAYGLGIWYSFIIICLKCMKCQGIWAISEKKNEKLKSLRTSPECFSDFGCDFQTSHSRPCCPPKVHAWNKKISPKNSGFQAKVGLTLIDSNPFWDIGCHRPVPETQHGVIPPTAR